MSTRAADDFEAIRKRLKEIRGEPPEPAEKEPATPEPPPPPTEYFGGY